MTDDLEDTTAPDEVVAPSDPPAAADSAEPDAPPTPAGTYDTFRVVEVMQVLFALPSASPVLELREADSPYRVLEFPIGLPEAQSIAMAMEHDTAPRPTAHELLVAVLRALGADIIALRITGERDGTLFGELDLMTHQGREVLDCRPTDGIAVALRQAVPAPILCEESLLDR